jgi:hypothetical protein
MHLHMHTHSRVCCTCCDEVQIIFTVLPFMRKPNGVYEITGGSPVLKLKNLYMQCDQARCKRISHHDAITMMSAYQLV